MKPSLWICLFLSGVLLAACTRQNSPLVTAASAASAPESCAAAPEEANRLYEAFVERLRGSTPVRTGVFGADMQIELVNDGPITLVVNSEDLIKK